MKPKTVYMIFAILLSVLLISVFIDLWLNKENAKIIPAAEKTEQQPSADEFHPAFSTELSHSPGVVSGAAVTVIKSLPKEKPAPVIEEKIVKNLNPERSVESFSQGGTNSRGGSGNVTGESTASVTTIIKHPSKEKQEEMNKRGIVMW